MSVQVVPSNGTPLTEEELRAATVAAEQAVNRVRALRRRMCDRCSADIEAVTVGGRVVAVDAAPVIPATEMRGLVVWPDPARQEAERIPAGRGQAIFRVHQCDRALRVVVVDVNQDAAQPAGTLA